MNISELIRKEILEATSGILPDAKDLSISQIQLEHPADSKFGDYSSNVAMVLNKGNPRELAEKIASELRGSLLLAKYINKTEVAGPGFINLFLSHEYLFSEVNLINKTKSEYGKILSKNKTRISLEHTDINPNKEPHIGHLRNACIGDSITRLLRFSGKEVKVQYYQNDAGVQVASIVLAYKKEYIKRADYHSLLEWASVAYVDIEKRAELDITVSAEKEIIQKNISLQDNSDSDLAREITDNILKEVLTIFNGLNISYDLIVRESDIVKNKLWEKTFELLKQKETFYKVTNGDKEGCWVIKLPKAEDKVIVRSNGVVTYTGNDIAYHLWKFGVLEDFLYKKIDWKIQNEDLYVTSVGDGEVKKEFIPADEVVNVIDISQTYPQEAVKEALNVIGYEKFSENYFHVNYGFVYLSNKTARSLGLSYDDAKPFVKISGRKGTVISITDFIKKLKGRLIEQHGEFDSVNDVVIGSLKFEMLKYNTYQDVVFDIDEALDQKGYSGPYIQYTAARALSIIRKSNVAESDLNIDLDKIPSLGTLADGLLKKLYLFEEITARASFEFAPHYLCRYLFELSQSFNSYYNSGLIIGSEGETEKLAIVNATALVIKNGLELLGINSPEKM